MPPPTKPEPAVLKIPKAKQIADKALVALGEKDETAVRALLSQVGAKSAKALQSGVGLMENEWAILMGPLNMAIESGDWVNAEKNMRGLVGRSKNATPP